MRPGAVLDLVCSALALPGACCFEASYRPVPGSFKM